MSDEQRFLTLGNGKQISIDKLLGKLEKKDIASNNKLLKIFDFFDKDGNGVIENSNSQGINEMASLWNTIKSSATKNGNSIFEENEANELLENIVDKDGKTLKDDGIFAKDLFGFLKFIVGKEQKTIDTNVENLTPIEYTAEEIKDITVNDMDNDVQKARELFEAQKNNQGDVSNFVNDTKENFDTKLASSRVERYIKNEEFTNYLIKKSNSEEGLSEKEYLELKVNHLINLISSLKEYSLLTEISANAINFTFFTGKKTNREREILDNELELSKIKEILERLTPEEINILTSQVLQLEDSPEQDSSYNIEFGGKNNTPKADVSELNNDSNRIDFKNQGFELEVSKSSIKNLSETEASYRKMSFEETFFKERGVEYNKEKIEEYLKKDAETQFLLGIHNRNEQIKDLLKDSTSLVKGNNSFGADSTIAAQGQESLETGLNLAFRQLYGEDVAKTQKIIDEILGKNSGGEVVINENYSTVLKFPEGGLRDFAMVKLSKGLQNKLDKNYQLALQGKSLEEHTKDLQVLYKEAYGNNNSEEMTKAFIESQQEGVQNTKAVVQGAGMVAMVGAQLIPLGGQLATSLVAGSGTLIATFGGTAVSAAENYSKAGGPTEEDKQAMLEELKTSLALVGSGMGIGKASSGLFRALVAKNCPKLLAWASEAGVDATASLLADYAITGQLDISGEGIAQIQNILVGLLHAKGNLKAYINTHAGELTNKTDVADVGKLAGKKKSDLSIIEQKNIANDVAVKNKKNIESNIDVNRMVNDLQDYINNKLGSQNYAQFEQKLKDLNPEEKLRALKCVKEAIDNNKPVEYGLLKDKYCRNTNGEFDSQKTNLLDIIYEKIVKKEIVATRQKMTSNSAILLSDSPETIFYKFLTNLAENNKFDTANIQYALKLNAVLEFEYLDDFIIKYSPKELITIKKGLDNKKYSSFLQNLSLLKIKLSKDEIKFIKKAWEIGLESDEWYRMSPAQIKSLIKIKDFAKSYNIELTENSAVYLNSNNANTEGFIKCFAESLGNSKKVNFNNITDLLTIYKSNPEKLPKILSFLETQNYVKNPELTIEGSKIKLTEANSDEKINKLYDNVSAQKTFFYFDINSLKFLNKRNVDGSYRAYLDLIQVGKIQFDETDFANNTQTNAEIELGFGIRKLKSQKITHFDENNNVLFIESWVPSKIKKGSFDIYQEFPDGTKHLISNVSKTPAGDIVIEKTIESVNGTKTNYVYFEGNKVDGMTNSLRSYDITDENNNVVMRKSCSVKYTDKNHYTYTVKERSENGNKIITYTTEIKDDTFCIKSTAGKEWNININELCQGNFLSRNYFMDILRKIPPEKIVLMKKLNIKITYDPKLINNCEGGSSIRMGFGFNKKDRPFIFLHELHHSIDYNIGLSSDKNLIKIFKNELEIFKKNSSTVNDKLIDYFTNEKDFSRSLKETIAEFGGILNSDMIPGISIRQQSLQQHFPKTCAYIEAKLRELEQEELYQ